jgi:ribose 1,5-bisphosphokinase PhnN
MAGSVDHEFCSDADFDAMVAAGRFAGTGRLPGLPYRYGLPVLTGHRGRPQLVLVRAGHVAELKRLGEPAVVYHLEAGADQCRNRLGARDLDPIELNARAGRHDVELALGRQLADRIFRNEGSLDHLAAAVGAALETDRKDLTR